MDKHRQFLFFCEGSPERGFGHVGRCLALADAIRSEHNQISRFVFRGSDTALSKITEAGFEVSLVENFNEWQFTDGDVVILDLLIPLKDSFFNRAAQSDVLLCTLDDPTPNRLKCDLAFYPPVPQVKKLGWKDFKGELFWDWRFIPLRKEFAKCQPKHSKECTPKLLITMGGSDPDGLTLKVLQALKSLPGNWSAPAGLKTEWVPLVKPYAMWTGMTFKAQLLSNGKPVANHDVEVEYMNHEPDMKKNAFKKEAKSEAPQDAFVTMGIKTDAHGYIEFAVPKAGWWGFCALSSGPDTEFKAKELSQDAVIWLKAVDMK